MKTLIPILLISLMLSCKKDDEQVINKVNKKPNEEWVLTDSVAYPKGCQLVVMKTYIRYVDGKESQIACVKDIIGQPCAIKTKGK